MNNASEPLDAESLSINALLWIAGDAAMMRRFLDLTGIEADQIRIAAQEPAFLAGVLKFILAHEPTLIAFAQSADIHPSTVGQALRALPGGDDGYLASS
ncbi:MAG: DUF3572 domain-containing protein [Rhizobiaceae bacterium]